jgi:hypothetical protein
VFRQLGVGSWELGLVGIWDLGLVAIWELELGS